LRPSFPLILVLLLYPDGRLPSRRWRPAVWLILTANALLLAVAATSDVAFEQAAPAGLAAPLALIPHRIAGPLVTDLEVVMLFLFLLSAAGCVVRYRRARWSRPPADQVVRVCGHRRRARVRACSLRCQTTRSSRSSCSCR
jgi:hypothetical protein